MSNTVKTQPGSVLYISHGGGPLPLLGDEGHHEMVDCLSDLARTLEKPAAIIVISAHWEENKPTITSGATPSLIYDYYGFPNESYDIRYPAPGDPLLAHKIFRLLNGSGIEAVLDEQRGFDHGVFVPLKIMFPDADIPCVQLSLVKSLNPLEHIRIGKALAGLKDDNVLIIGSGSSFHNIKAFLAPPIDEVQSRNTSFEKWLIHTCSDRQMSENEREIRLLNWEIAPAARYCHPREEHLLPLHVCYGIAGSAAKKVIPFDIMGKKTSAYLW